MDKDVLHIVNARENNLKNLDLEIPHNTLTVITGLSGSGKSSLAFDTIFAEGQRRFIETFSPYIRQFLDKIKKPDVDLIESVRAAIAIQQRTRINNSRSTVGSMTDIVDYLKIIWTNLAKPTCHECGIELESWDSDSLKELLLKWQKVKSASTFYICVPFKEHSLKPLRTEIERLVSLGFVRCLNVRTGEIILLEDITSTNLKGMLKDIILLLDRIQPRRTANIQPSLEQAFNLNKNHVIIAEVKTDYRPFIRISQNRAQTNQKQTIVEQHHFYSHPTCPSGDLSLPKLQPSLFSYNHPNGSCPVCKGFGKTLAIDPLKCVPNQNLSIEAGAVQCWETPKTANLRRKLIKFCHTYDIPTDVAWKKLSKEEQDLIFNHKSREYYGVFPWFKMVERMTYKMYVRVFLSRYRSEELCPNCHGTRLRPESSAYRIAGLQISDLWNMSIEDLLNWLKNLRSTLQPSNNNRHLLDVFDAAIGRIEILDKLGLSYLTLNRQSKTLSGGETQRVNLAAALGSQLTSTEFVLDEPSVGLHAHDTEKLIETIRELQKKGNSVLLVEHDPDCIDMADHVIELGPEAGEKGGEIIYSGPAANWKHDLGQLVHLQENYNLDNHPVLTIKNANARNLKNINLEIPLRSFVCISGVSGSGKSTLINEIIKYEYDAFKTGIPSRCEVEGFKNISELVIVDQSALTKAPRANIATYCDIWEIVRKLLASSDDAKIRGLNKSSFSFNVEGGRCPACEGAGFIREDMQFLSDVYIPCEQCLGKRFKNEVLEVKYHGLNVHDFLQMSVSACKEFFSDDHFIQYTCDILDKLGLGHLTLGHPLSELSGGEAQRLKLIPFLQKTANDKALLIFDEPTTGLHNKDVNKLIDLFYLLRDKGHSILVVEHNLSFLSAADWLIDLGPYSGIHGGEVVKTGTPRDFIEHPSSNSLTSQHLKRFCENKVSKKNITSLPQRRSATSIVIKGAREHNLQNISLTVPLQQIVALCGVSGSGKSSIAKDIIYAEGQRRYLDCLSPYARQFIKELKRPDIDSISNILPTICVYQHTFQPSQLSTIASMSEAYNYLRLLYSKTAVQYCPDHPNERISPLQAEDIANEISHITGRVKILAPIIKQKKGNHKQIFERAIDINIDEVRVDNMFVKTSTMLEENLSKTRPHTIEYVIGTFNPKNVSLNIIQDCVSQTLNLGSGTLIVNNGSDTIFSTERTCPICKRGFFKPDPEDLSFNSARGACPSCNGFGKDSRGRICRECGGSRINSVASNLRLADMNIHQACLLTPSKLKDFLVNYHFTHAQKNIADTVLRELYSKLDSIISLGLDYLPLDRDCSSLSGGELQRLRLATAMGSPLTGVLYIFDEPSAGLHPLDNQKVLNKMHNLKEHGNSVIMIEHDEESIRQSDYVIEIGPGGGTNGGNVVASQAISEFIKNRDSVTAAALRGELKSCEDSVINQSKETLTIQGGNFNNIHDLHLTLPLMSLVTVAGVSGAGKSSLVHGIIKEILTNGKSSADKLTWKLNGTTIKLSNPIMRVETVDQKPIGANSRSTPASYLGLLNEIRSLLAKTIDAQTIGWDASFFSYNTGKGRCPTCEGRGDIKLQMTFLADASIECEECHGERFREEVKSIKFNGFNIVDILNMTIEEASSVFANHNKINHILHTACEIGLGYLTLGQSSTTLSGGESQRLKLVSELSARHKGSVLYILDEPTIGLHRTDVARLLKILRQLTNKGHSVIIIEHDKDFIYNSDYLIELGPKAGDEGGKVIFSGIPQDLALNKTPWSEYYKSDHNMIAEKLKSGN